jgi:hypothetical protein
MKRFIIIPENPDARCGWFLNFKNEFTLELATQLGFQPGEHTAISLEADWVMFACRLGGDADTYAQACAEWRDAVFAGDDSTPAGAVPQSNLPPLPVISGGSSGNVAPPPARNVIGRFRGYIRRIKAAPQYTPAIGETLRIVGSAVAPIDPDTAKPDLLVKPQAGFKARVRWQRKGFPAVKAQMRREGQTEWVDLGTILDRTFVDETPTSVPGQPEVCNYRAMYQRGNTPVGQWSDVVSVTKQP